MGKKREKYEMLSEYVPLFDWSNQVTCFAPKFKHSNLTNVWGMAEVVDFNKIPLEDRVVHKVRI